MIRLLDSERLEELYRRYNRREFVHPDPLEFLYRYDDPLERELVGLVASSLAYGRVAQILRSVGVVLARLGPSPRGFILGATRGELEDALAGFKHRFTTGTQLAGLLWGARGVILRHGSLGAFFSEIFDGDMLAAQERFVDELLSHSGLPRPCYLLPSPACGSACKRLNLYLRWMVRRDEVDPGGWKGVPAASLIVPTDTHMHRIALALGLTKRRQADLRAALEITDAFREVAPEDPVRYDFALTRLGIRDDTDVDAFPRACGVGKQEAGAAWHRAGVA